MPKYFITKGGIVFLDNIFGIDIFSRNDNHKKEELYIVFYSDPNSYRLFKIDNCKYTRETLLYILTELLISDRLIINIEDLSGEKINK